MNKSLARCHEAGSFIAGLLIGLSILVPVFATMVADTGDRQGLWAVGALTILAAGLALQSRIHSAGP